MLALVARVALLLSGVALLAVLNLPRIVAEDGSGSWRYAVTAANNAGFREERSFRSRQACEAARGAMAQDVAQVLTAQRPGTRVGDLARRLQLGPCRAGHAGG